MRIAVAATPALTLPILETLYSQHEILFVLTQPDRPAGRGRAMRESDVAQWAHTKNLPVYKELASCERIHDVELVITIAYGVLIPSSILALPRYGFINLHYSLLPKFRGAAPVQRSLMAGDTESGVTVFQLDRGMDTGPIFVQRRVEIEDWWNCDDLFAVLSRIGSEALLETLDQVQSGEQPHPQEGAPSLAPKIAKSELHINFSHSSTVIRNHIRGLFPDAYMEYGTQRIKVLSGLIGPSCTAVPGSVVSLDPLTIACGEGTSLTIDRVLPEGKRAMSAAEWLRGARIESGSSFG